MSAVLEIEQAVSQYARTQNTRTPTTPRTRLSGIVGWDSWTVASFREEIRADEAR